MAGEPNPFHDPEVSGYLDEKERRIVYLESQLRRIAHGNWSNPLIDSAGANTYAQIASEMRNIAKLALTAHVE